MDATRSAAELVGLWQDLQASLVAGDRRGVARVLARARAGAARADDPSEWQLLAETAERHLAQLTAMREGQPDVEVGGSTAPPSEAEEEVAAERGGAARRGIQLVWLVILLAYVALQVLGGQE